MVKDGIFFYGKLGNEIKENLRSELYIWEEDEKKYFLLLLLSFLKRVKIEKKIKRRRGKSQPPWELEVREREG